MERCIFCQKKETTIFIPTGDAVCDRCLTLCIVIHRMIKEVREAQAQEKANV
jgi:hypothetical protein